MKIDPQREAALRRLADEIARTLFTDGGTHERAARLVLAFRKPGADATITGSEYQTGTGWGEKPVRDVILRHLRRAEAAKRRKT